MPNIKQFNVISLDSIPVMLSNIPQTMIYVKYNCDENDVIFSVLTLFAARHIMKYNSGNK